MAYLEGGALLLQVCICIPPLLNAAVSAASSLPQLLQLSHSCVLLLLQVSICSLPLLNGAATAGCSFSQFLQLSLGTAGSRLCF